MYKRQAHPFSCTHDDLIRTGQGPYGHRFLVFSAREDYAPIVDDYAQGEFRQGVLYTLESLGDLSGHQYQRIYRMENGKLQESGSYGYFSSQRRQLNGPQLCIEMCIRDRSSPSRGYSPCGCVRTFGISPFWTAATA